MKYDAILLEPLRDMMLRVAHFIPTLLLALAILIVGYVFAHAFERLLMRLLKILEFDKVAEKMGIAHVLKNGGVKERPSELIGRLTYLVLIITVLIMIVKTFGLTAVSGLLDAVLGFIPSVIGGILVLTIGMLIAQVVSSMVYVVAKNTDMPLPDAVSRLCKYAIMVFVTIMFLKEIGFVSLFEGSHYTIFVGGMVFAIALAFGLAGKDIAARYLDVLNIKKSDHAK
ncbi:MAG: hypothetical protein A3G91_04435 [Omnitrophica WOR_2 bacterium RIFCSPLOWO2_12_FULL_50_9]|nr:MAG: hypothetical protein A3D87_03685 [Omnitrophica WOR_2 bacterium RIFCSPHIGHO2_02_FULL_50_17]OGX40806.1 MAG: hypothetical protein A3G91_04435 [Omnitrophica WOR_2 bacterium RIFCSPLOWO2_12_FULL_50_9]